MHCSVFGKTDSLIAAVHYKQSGIYWINFLLHRSAVEVLTAMYLLPVSVWYDILFFYMVTLIIIGYSIWILHVFIPVIQLSLLIIYDEWSVQAKCKMPVNFRYKWISAVSSTSYRIYNRFIFVQWLFSKFWNLAPSLLSWLNSLVSCGYV